MSASFPGRPLPPAFARREITLAPGATRRYVTAEWRDALVVVERGALELEGLSGTRRRFEPGAVLWLWSLPLRASTTRIESRARLLSAPSTK